MFSRRLPQESCSRGHSEMLLFCCIQEENLGTDQESSRTMCMLLHTGVQPGVKPKRKYTKRAEKWKYTKKAQAKAAAGAASPEAAAPASVASLAADPAIPDCAHNSGVQTLLRSALPCNVSDANDPNASCSTAPTQSPKCACYACGCLSPHSGILQHPASHCCITVPPSYSHACGQGA